MPRPGERRVAAATKVSEADSDELKAIAAAAGVAQSDVVRAGVELVLRGVDRGRLIAYLAEVGRESQSAALTPDREGRLLGVDLRDAPGGNLVARVFVPEPGQPLSLNGEEYWPISARSIMGGAQKWTYAPRSTME